MAMCSRLLPERISQTYVEYFSWKVTTKAAREAQAEAIGAFMFEVQELDALTEFDEKLWLTIFDTVTIHADGRMTFKFQGGTEIDA